MSSLSIRIIAMRRIVNDSAIWNRQELVVARSVWEQLFALKMVVRSQVCRLESMDQRLSRVLEDFQ